MPHHLALVLAALSRQSFQDFEIILCDDGSGKETNDVAEKFYSCAKIPLVHLWQENLGFRKCRLLNEGIRKSSGEILIFLDGDCVPHFEFISDHVRCTQNGVFSAGRRVEVSRIMSGKITENDVKNGFFDRPSLCLLRDHLFGETVHWNRSIRWGMNPWIRKILKLDQIDDLKGCNFSATRDDLLKINGFDEAYAGYGREDTDVEIRMLNSGLCRRSLKGVALQFHLWHERRGFTPTNERLLESARTLKRIRCERGVLGGDSSGIKVMEHGTFRDQSQNK